MKATEKMINAACEATPDIKREDTARIIQAALDADAPSANPQPKWVTLVSGSAVISAVITFFFVILGSTMSGTWLDPRVWSGEYVPGDTMASSMSNGAWMMEATADASIWVFIGIWVLALGVAVVSKKAKSH
ncbi:hypothetical protein AWH63_10025 [Marinobacter sp. C18]|uniref:hypothetical protein n=1 Tax=Marinobacter sp. C18 TaxID=1772288 RepID=UPI000948EF2A|nr:hypothetical protein [Marinobacter sp. C18]OLF81871.1 hypothetical protein AWH63_10025 [Marinobacter sp. C18]